MNPTQVLSLLVALWLPLPCAFAADYLERINTPFPIPDGYQHVNDYAGVLRIARRVEISKKLQALERRNGTQIVFLSVPNVGTDGANVYGQAVFAKWNIGNNGQGNGVLYLVGNDDSLIFTGPGIAGAIPDVTLARIRRDIMVPASNRDEVSEGVEATLDALIKAAWGEDTTPTDYDYAHPHRPMTPEQVMVVVLTTCGVCYAIFLFWRRRRGHNAATP